MNCSESRGALEAMTALTSGLRGLEGSSGSGGITANSIQRHLLAGADGLDHLLRVWCFAQAFGDVFALDQAGNVGEQAWLDARHAARRQQQKDQLGTFVGGFEWDAFVGAGKGQQRALDTVEPAVRDGQAVAKVGGHGGFAPLHDVSDDLRVGGEFFPRYTGYDYAGWRPASTRRAD